MKNIKQENGRSMVEMLGVLAIIGVLSIGGIAGYTMAMNRYRANEIIDTASKLSVVAQTAGANGGTVKIPGWSDIGLSAIPHNADINVCTNGQAKVTVEATGVQNALSSITGESLCDGIVVVKGSEGNSSCGDVAEDATAPASGGSGGSEG